MKDGNYVAVMVDGFDSYTVMQPLLPMYDLTAFGIIKAAFGLNLTRKQKFSLQVYDTQMAASKSLKDHFDNLFKLIPAASLYPNRECSVLMVFTP